jgi:hypothetical protein
MLVIIVIGLVTDKHYSHLGTVSCTDAGAPERFSSRVCFEPDTARFGVALTV